MDKGVLSGMNARFGRHFDLPLSLLDKHGFEGSDDIGHGQVDSFDIGTGKIEHGQFLRVRRGSNGASDRLEASTGRQVNYHGCLRGV